MLKLWEILVPTIRNNGRPIHLRFHRIWDQKVLKLTGGLTILKPTQGKWVSPDKKLFAERMIPVRIACTRDQIKQIADLTLSYYEQEAVFYYLVSEKVYIEYAKNK